jgi:heme/copper-type cytochrome/quinol oxidase subunit 2
MKWFRSLKNDNRAFAKAMGGMIALLVAIIIGVLVYYSVVGGFTVSSATYGSDASDAMNGTNDTAETVFTLLPIVGIVMIAGLILAVVSRFGGGGGGV